MYSVTRDSFLFWGFPKLHSIILLKAMLITDEFYLSEK